MFNFAPSLPQACKRSENDLAKARQTEKVTRLGGSPKNQWHPNTGGYMHLLQTMLL